MSAPQQPSYGQPGFNAPVQGKSRVTVGLLNFFLGGVGAGDFYLGHTQMGIYKIIALVVSYALVIGGGVAESAIIAGLGTILVMVYGIFVFACMIMSFMGKWIYAADSNGVPTV